MIDTNEFYEVFKHRIKWCDKNLIVVKKKMETSSDKYFLKLKNMLLEYQRDCRIACRRIELLNKKYENLNKAPSEVQTDLKETLAAIRFTKYADLDGHLKGSP
jgi:hypothetical protein